MASIALHLALVVAAAAAVTGRNNQSSPANGLTGKSPVKSTYISSIRACVTETTLAKTAPFVLLLCNVHVA